MSTFWVRAKTQSGLDIGRFKIELESNEPLGEDDVLVIEEEIEE